MLIEMDGEKTQRCFRGKHCIAILKRNAILWSVVLGALVGFGIGFSMRGNSSDNMTMWIGIPGDVYMRLLKMSILPLVISSIITGTASLDAKSSGRLGILSVMYILIVNSSGAVLGVIFYYIVRPGKTDVNTFSGEEQRNFQLGTNDMFADLIRSVEKPAQ